MGKFKDNAYTMSDVTSIPDYVWDGNKRPVLSDYTKPWNVIASGPTYNNPLKYWITENNSAVYYAINKIKEATAQFEQDLAYWNERDERLYTTPLAQTQRYGEAGYNMGYLYGNVDSGNSAVGYDQGDSQFDISTPPNVNRLEPISKIFGMALDVAKFVPSLVKLPSELNLNKAREELSYAQLNDANASAMIKDLQGGWFQFLREHDKDGNQVSIGENDAFNWSESIAFLLEKEKYKISKNERRDLDLWLESAADVYENQTISNVSASNRLTDELWDSDLPMAAKITIAILQSLLPSGISGGSGGKRK